MGTASIRTCDICGKTPKGGVSRYQVAITPVISSQAPVAAPPAMPDMEAAVDLCPAHLGRLKGFINRGLTAPGAPGGDGKAGEGVQSDVGEALQL